MLRVPAIFRRALLTPALAALLVLAAGSAQATPAGPTATLGRRGDVTTTFGLKTDDLAQAVAVQPDGRIVAAGYSSGGSGSGDSSFALLRYRPDGTLDSTFGLDGKVTTDFGAGGSTAQAVAVQPDGKIVAAGETVVTRPDFDIALARYNADGALDAGFGSGGKVTATFGPTSDFAGAVAVQPDGKIVLAGASGVPQQRDEAFALARFKPDGSLDSGFGSAGMVTTRFASPGDEAAQALVLQPDGKIVAVGSELVGSREGPSDFALARYTPEGVLDPTFGSGGKVTTTFGSASDFANGAVLQPDGKIVVAGYSFQGRVGPSAFALARYMPDGSLDPSFGSGGRVMTDVGPDGTAWAVALQRDGKIVAAGTGRGVFALARYNPNGSLDQSFGTGGIVSTAVGTGDEALARAVAVQPEGKVVVAGSTVTCTYDDFTLARYTPAGVLDRTFGSNGKRCFVPNVKRMKLDAAKRAIRSRDCAVGPITRAFSRAIPSGRVVGQYPLGGRRCDVKIKVVLQVSKGMRARP